MTVSLKIEPVYGSFDPLAALASVQGEADWAGLRFVETRNHRRRIRNGHPDQNGISFERGIMLEALVDGHIAYAATSDLSPEGVRQAMRKAAASARLAARRSAAALSARQRPPSTGVYHPAPQLGLDAVGLAEFTDQLLQASRRLKVSDRIVTTIADASLVETTMHYVTSNGSDIRQDYLLTGQNFVAIAQDGTETRQRSLNGPTARCWQAGLERFDWNELGHDCERTGEEALALLDAENCPDEVMDLILAPDQMLLQIHESIGHPLELDRILGDERNYAGWSFVRPEDFGTLQYGSPLMNVSFDPGLAGEFASYGWDDGGHAATREYLIREGRLLRGLGGLESQDRLRLPGVASFRSCGWNRAPIDRMGNINLEPGDASLESMIASTRRGIYMQANRSWSIDDYRNKFQFGCEYAQLIEDGRLTRVVSNPNYRGITTPFWNALAAVGHSGEFRAYGTPFCGKGEPNQMIRVGHASPPCLFRSIQVFGG